MAAKTFAIGADTFQSTVRGGREWRPVIERKDGFGVSVETGDRVDAPTAAPLPAF